MAFRDILGKLEEKAIGVGVGALGLIADEEVFENVGFWHRNAGRLRQAHQGIIPLLAGIGGVALGFEGVDDGITVGVSNMLKGAYDAFIKKKPFCIAKSSSEIECWGLDANESISSITVDGSAVTVSATTDANGHVLITGLSLTSGKHDVKIETSKKGFYGVVVV